jgi:hypothetical protein
MTPYDQFATGQTTSYDQFATGQTTSYDPFATGQTRNSDDAYNRFKENDHLVAEIRHMK